MPIKAENCNLTHDLTALVGRALMSAIFIWSGYGKLVSPAEAQAYFVHVGVVFPQLVWVVAVLIEFVGGLTLLLGIQARPTAAVLGVWCIATAIAAHANFSDPNMQIHFMKNVAMAGGFTVIAGYGAGAYTLGRLISRARG